MFDDDGTGVSGESDNYNTQDNLPKLVTPIAQFLCFLPDAIFQGCQKMFIGNKPIQNELTEEYSIKYSPAIIFSGKVPAFDINFIGTSSQNKGNDDEDKESEESAEMKEGILSNIKNGEVGDIFSRLNGDKPEYKHYNSYENSEIKWENERDKLLNENNYNDGIIKGNITSNAIDYDEWYIAKDTEDIVISGKVENDNAFWISDNKIHLMVFSYVRDENSRTYETAYALYELDLTDEQIQAVSENLNVNQKSMSTATILRPVIATWYNALRKIALISLLSTLVYIGIRIIMTSVSKDKAKYKMMLKDWLVAVCILFTMHYIISITVTVVQGVTEFVNASSMESTDEDIMLTTIRNKIANANNWGDALINVFIYSVVAVYTVIFTVQYLKRTVYLAFLTMIAPLITFTYPLDKIKDKQSQAFDMWIKDYVYFSLLQVIHALIYYILIGSSLDLANEGNWLFAIITISCLVPVEKIVRNMFGFNKSKTLGSAIGETATGAVMMNIINKIGGKKPKKTGGSSEGKGEEKGKEQGAKTKIRTATNSNMTQPIINPSTSSSLGIRSALNNTWQNLNPNVRGAVTLAGKYGAQASKAVGRTAIKVSAGGTFAVFGLSKAIVQGDAGGAFKSTIAAGAIGNSLGEKIADGVIDGGYIKSVEKGINKTKGVWNKVTNRDKGTQNESIANAFENPNDYLELKTRFGDNLTDEKISKMMDAGVTEKRDMEKILESENMDEAISYYTLAKKCPDEIFYANDDILERYLKDVAKGLNLSSNDIATMRKKIKQFRK